ncbi:Tpx2 [Thalictrum thalictroides]|uniref:Tpx2 n=1 Tax=Thalictrum thalictroides TaxID=46969 RepID=A0A7J6VRN7_THATH|nr:Tpx2 [Thalictrum thalictroides]
MDCNTMIDETYEFSAPRFFDFTTGETDEEMQIAEIWFETALSYAPSPFMPRIRDGRSVQIESLCDFSDVEHSKKDKQSSDSAVDGSSVTEEPALASQVKNSERIVLKTVASVEISRDDQIHHNEPRRISIVKEIPVANKPCENNGTQRPELKQSVSGNTVVVKEIVKAIEEISFPVVSVVQGQEVCTPKMQIIKKKTDQLLSASKKNQTAKNSLVKNPSSLKPKQESHLSQAKGVKPIGSRSVMTAKKAVTAQDFQQESQAIKRQKLEGGHSRQILNVKPQNLPHNKSRLGLTSNAATKLCSSTTKEDRKLYVREAAPPFISTAEMVRRFQSSTRDENTSSMIQGQRKPKLTLTRPKEPDFETSHRARSVSVKSFAELEEEMMANIPKFKARPVNKKILEAPTLPALPRSTPQLPEFQEFHLKTMERANQNAETSSVVSTESSHRNQWNPNKLTEPKPPRLVTMLRARPPKAKSSQELEQEELEKVPKFKARPLNKRIFESKGDMGLFSQPKRQVTRPREFHFATDERIPQAKSVADLFDKLSLNSESRHDHQLPRITTPNPFHLNTEERGAEKERRFVVEVMQKKLEEERARVPKATPYPYTTDYPVIPPKPEPKQCTKPEPFQLESLVRHEEEIQREMEERRRLEKEEAQMRIFKAQPILKEDPLPVPEKERKPLTQV